MNINIDYNNNDSSTDLVTITDGKVVINLTKDINSKTIKVNHVINNNKVIQSIEYIIEDNIDVDIIETFNVSNSIDSLFDVNVRSGVNSHIKLYSIDNIEKRSDNKFTFNRVSKIHRDSSLKYYIGLFSDIDLDMNLDAILAGEGAEATIDLVTIATVGNTQNLDIKVTHDAENTTGLINNSAVVSGNSKVVINGTGKINSKMKGSNARQTTRGTILSKEGKLQANPFLLIDEYDVAASHGAAIGKISDEGLFYLMSRGLSKKDAEKLIVAGFINPILSKITDEDTKEVFKNRINAKLGQNDRCSKDKKRV